MARMKYDGIEDLRLAWNSAVSIINQLKTIINNGLTGALKGGALDVGTTTTKVKTTSTFIYEIAGVVYAYVATDDIGVPGVNTTGVQYRKVSIQIDAAGTVTFVAGATAASQGAAVHPPVGAGKVEIGWLELPVSFTSGTTVITSGMIQQTVAGGVVSAIADTDLETLER